MSRSKSVLYHIFPKIKDKSGWQDTGSEKSHDCIYEGEVKNGMPHGNGIYTKTDGSKYVGQFKNGLRDGQGTFTLAYGKKYVGEFKDGKQHGQGTFTGADGKVKKKGIWKKGNLVKPN